MRWQRKILASIARALHLLSRPRKMKRRVCSMKLAFVFSFKILAIHCIISDHNIITTKLASPVFSHQSCNLIPSSKRCPNKMVLNLEIKSHQNRNNYTCIHSAPVSRAKQPPQASFIHALMHSCINALINAFK